MQHGVDAEEEHRQAYMRSMRRALKRHRQSADVLRRALLTHDPHLGDSDSRGSTVLDIMATERDSWLAPHLRAKAPSMPMLRLDKCGGDGNADHQRTRAGAHAPAPATASASAPTVAPATHASALPHSTASPSPAVRGALMDALAAPSRPATAAAAAQHARGGARSPPPFLSSQPRFASPADGAGPAGPRLAHPRLNRRGEVTELAAAVARSLQSTSSLRSSIPRFQRVKDEMLGRVHPMGIGLDQTTSTYCNPDTPTLNAMLDRAGALDGSAHLSIAASVERSLARYPGMQLRPGERRRLYYETTPNFDAPNLGPGMYRLHSDFDAAARRGAGRRERTTGLDARSAAVRRRRMRAALAAGDEAALRDASPPPAPRDAAMPGRPVFPPQGSTPAPLGPGVYHQPHAHDEFPSLAWLREQAKAAAQHRKQTDPWEAVLLQAEAEAKARRVAAAAAAAGEDMMRAAAAGTGKAGGGSRDSDGDSSGSDEGSDKPPTPRHKQRHRSMHRPEGYRPLSRGRARSRPGADRQPLVRPGGTGPGDGTFMGTAPRFQAHAPFESTQPAVQSPAVLRGDWGRGPGAGTQKFSRTELTAGRQPFPPPPPPHAADLNTDCALAPTLARSVQLSPRRYAACFPPPQQWDKPVVRHAAGALAKQPA